MSNILFLQNTIAELQGVMYLSRKLKDAGHSVHVLISRDTKHTLEYIDTHGIEAVLFSLLYGYQFWARDVSAALKSHRPRIKLLWGGIFPTFNVDYLQQVRSCVDAFCVGEGDDAVVPLVEAALGGGGFNTIRGAAYLKDGLVTQNPLCDYADISQAMPDRDLYFSHSSILAHEPTKIFVCSRGCIGNCSYCYNSKLKELYKDNPKPYVRSRNPGCLIEEINYVKKKYGMKRIFFYDDILVYDKPWAHEFLPKLKSAVNVPYMCYTRADVVDEEVVKLLKETGCYMVSFGLESGNEELRAKVLHKKITNAQIERAAAIFHEFRLPFNTTNMMGFPHETYRMGLETLELNIKIGAVGSCNILNPFPGTELYEYCRSKNLFEEKYFLGERTQIHYYPMIKNPDRASLGNLERLFQLAVFFPRTMYPIVKRIGRWRPNVFFDIVFLVMQFFYVKFCTEKYSMRFVIRYYSEKMRSVFTHA